MSFDNSKAGKTLRAAAQAMRQLPGELANYYANPGKGNSNPPVGDRFMGKGNARFEPLSASYAAWKTGQSKSLNKKQAATFLRGSRLVKGSLPILVRTGALRQAVAYQGGHKVIVRGDTGYVTFDNLPEYAIYLHTGTKKMPKRSPVEPNDADMRRVKEFGDRWISLRIKTGSASTGFGGGTARVI